MTERRSFAGIIAICTATLLIVTAACSADRTREPVDCAIQAGPCVRMTGSGTEVIFDIQPRPVKAMAELIFAVTVSKDGRPVSGAKVALDLTMPGMHMGENRPRLSPGKGGRYAGKGVIVRCPSGRKVWKAQITVTSKHDDETASFLFEVI